MPKIKSVCKSCGKKYFYRGVYYPGKIYDECHNCRVKKAQMHFYGTTEITTQFVDVGGGYSMMKVFGPDGKEIIPRNV